MSSDFGFRASGFGFRVEGCLGGERDGRGRACAELHGSELECAARGIQLPSGEQLEPALFGFVKFIGFGCRPQKEVSNPLKEFLGLGNP